jgi:hypothetical protein
MTATHTQPEPRILNEDELTLVSGGAKDLLAGMPTQVSYIGAFMSGYYSTCGCVSTGHSANWQG